MVVEADVLGPSDDAPQSRNRSRSSDSYTAQTMPHMAPTMAQGAHRRSSYTAGERLSAPLNRYVGALGLQSLYWSMLSVAGDHGAPAVTVVAV